MQGERNGSTAWGSSWTGPLPALHRQSLQLSELERAVPQPRVWLSWGPQAPGRGRSRSANTATFVRRSSGRGDFTPHTRLAWADREGAQRQPRSLSPAAPITLQAGGAPINFFFGSRLRFKYSLPRPFDIRPLRPACQCPRQQKLLVAAPGALSV